MTIPDLNVLLILGDPTNSHFIDEEQGMSGFSGISGHVAIAVWPTSRVLDRHGAIAVHELHHNVRYSPGEIVSANRYSGVRRGSRRPTCDHLLNVLAVFAIVGQLTLRRKRSLGDRDRSIQAGNENMRSGSEYLRRLEDARCVYVDGERIENVSSHPATAPIARAVAKSFDFAADPANDMTFVAPETGREANRAFSTPRSVEDLRLRREAHLKLAALTRGFVGRSPDHVPSTIAAMAAHREIFDAQDTRFGDNIQRFYRRVLDESLFVAYTIIPPQVSRDTVASGWGEDFLQLGVVSSNEHGIVVRGSVMLASSSAVADELFVSCIRPLKEVDRDFAVTFAVPTATEGLKLILRRPYAASAPSVYDYPLSSQYDETDAFVVFDDVLVPWDRVFVDRDPAQIQRAFHASGAHVFANWQAQARLSVKLDFMLGIAHRVASMNRVDKFPGVIEKLGDLASLASSVRSSLLAAEYEAVIDDAGFAVPGRAAIYGQVARQGDLYANVVNILRDLCGGGVLQVPSSVADFSSRLTGPAVKKYIVSPGVAAEERIKLFKLAWDVIGSEFAGRHQQYEMFYNAAPHVTRTWAYQNYDYEAAMESVDRFLASYDVDTVVAVDADSTV